jgi:hypothetical protein
MNFPTQCAMSVILNQGSFPVLGWSWNGVPAVHSGEPARYKSLRCLRLNPGRPANHTSQETDVERPYATPPPRPANSPHPSANILHTKTSQFQHFLDAFVRTDNLLCSVVDPVRSDSGRFALK